MLSLTMLVTLGAPVFSLDDEESLNFYRNNIYYYDPNGNTGDCDSGILPDTSDATLIGDSLSVSAVKQIENKMPGIDYKAKEYDGTKYELIQNSKHFTLDVDGNASGITIAKQLKEHGDLKQYLIFELGTNDPNGGVTTEDIDRLLDIVGKEHKVVLVTNASDGSNGAPKYGKNNKAMEEVASSKENVKIANWAEVVGDNDKKYIDDSADHVHLSEKGKKEFAQTLYDGLFSFGSSASKSSGGKVSVGNAVVSGKSREEVVWNWLSTNIPSLTAEQKAAILGNAKAESGALDPFMNDGEYLGIFQMKDERRAGLEKLMHERGVGNISGSHTKDEVYKGISATLEYMFTKDDRAVGFLENLDKAGNLSGEDAVRAYSDMWLVHVEGAYDHPQLKNKSILQPLAHKEACEWSDYLMAGSQGKYLYQHATKREDLSIDFYKKFGNGTGSGSGYCVTQTCGAQDVDGYTFPIDCATKANYLQPGGKLESVLSRLPCPGKGCHHDHAAVDLGIDAKSVGIKQDEKELKSGYSKMYYYSMGAKVVALTDGKISSYKHYGRAVGGYQQKCASIIFDADDGTSYWLGHMSYDKNIKAGDKFKKGDVIGEIGPPQCAIGTQSHLHVDLRPNYNPEIYDLFDKLWEALPNG